MNISIQLKWDTFNRVSYFLFFPGTTLLHIVALLFKTPNHWIWCLEKVNIGMNWLNNKQEQHFYTIKI